MNLHLFAALCLLLLPGTLVAQAPARLDLPVMDLHSDQLYRYDAAAPTLVAQAGTVSVPELLRGGFAAQVFTLYVDPAPRPEVMARGRELVVAFQAQMLTANDAALRLATNAADLQRNHAQGKVSAMLALEDAHVLGDDPANLDWYADQGVRIVGLVWNNGNAFGAGLEADTAPSVPGAPAVDRGLTRRGLDLLRRMQHRHLVADVSHASNQTFWDVLTTARGPVLATHSNAKAIFNHPRNLDDEQILALSQKQGLVGLCLHSPFLTNQPRAGAAEILAQYRYVAGVGGAGGVALGADLGATVTPASPVDRAGDLPALWAALADLGLSRADLEGLAYANFQRFWQDSMERYDQIPPLDWRPLAAKAVDPKGGDEVMFDRLSTTGRRFCGPEARKVRLGVAAEAAPNQLALRVRADTTEAVGRVSVTWASEDGRSICASATCPADGSRCVLIPAKPGGKGAPAPQSAQRFSVTLQSEVPQGGCLEVLDVVPLKIK